MNTLAPQATRILDFFHAVEHLHDGIASVFGDGSLKTQQRFEALRHTLRHDDSGVTKVIRALAYIEKTQGSTSKLKACLGYFRRHRRLMDYAYFARCGLPIGLDPLRWTVFLRSLRDAGCDLFIVGGAQIAQR